MGQLDTRNHIKSMPTLTPNNAEVIVAVKTSDGIMLYEGVADRIDVEEEYEELLTLDSTRFHRIDTGHTMTIHFIGSIREVEDGSGDDSRVRAQG